MLTFCGLALLLLLSVGARAAVPPCSQLLSDIHTQPGEWRATLTIPIPDQPNAEAFEGWHLKLIFAQPVDTLRGWNMMNNWCTQHNATGATMSTVDDRNFILRVREGYPGKRLVLKLCADHGISALMGLDTVKYNNVAVCNVHLAPIIPVPSAVPPCLDLLTDVGAHERPGEWTSVLGLPIPNQPNAAAFKGWHLKLTFDQTVEYLTHNGTGATVTTVDDRNFIMRGNTRNVVGQTMYLKLNVKHPEDQRVKLVTVKYNNMVVCNGTRQYDYARALSLSLLFLEAQQSGPLPGDKRIPWRGDSCLNDRGKRGEDLTGGYFTGSVGRTVKFTFPNAAANTILAWGMITHESAYRSAGEVINGMAMVDWGARYLSKCYTSNQDVYAVVGDQVKEPAEFWGRPEDLNYPRPTLALTPDNPGSDLFGEVVASLASASVVTKGHWEGPQVSSGYLSQARRLFEMATENRGDYLRAMQLLTWYQVHTPRNGDECELIWAAVWMYRATAEQRYLQLAQKFYTKLNFRQRRFTYFYWDDKAVGAQILLYQITKDSEYAYDARIFCDTITGNSSLHTSRGIVRGIGNFASGIQLGAWASFACLELGETLVRYGAEKTNPYIDFAVRHANYILGDSGRSFMVGFGNNYPKRPNHIASLCAPPPAPCNQALFESDTENHNVLLGALVFGPDEQDRYEDSRRGVHNNVDIVSNAGLSSLLAALIDLRAEGKIP